jgi:uncharacterized membrane protein YphA (DoxX/SURF4 family)
LQRLYLSFPHGSPGIGLLLLRTAAAAVLIAHGATCLAHRSDATWGTWAVGLTAILTGALLVIGLLTPLAGALGALGSAGVALSWLPSPARATLGAGGTGLLLAVVMVAIALLGPGAISMDALLFGRREITIPRMRDAAREE